MKHFFSKVAQSSNSLICGIRCFFRFQKQKLLKGTQKQLFLQEDRNETIFFLKSCAIFYFEVGRRNDISLLIRSCFWLQGLSYCVVFFSQKTTCEVAFRMSSLFSGKQAPKEPFFLKSYTIFHSNQHVAKKLAQQFGICFALR